MGGSDGNFAVARYTTGGALDTSFNSTGKRTTDFTLSCGKPLPRVGWGLPHHIPQPPRSGLIVPLDQRHVAQHDANFNITSITDANGQVAERYLYTAYGEVTAADGAWYSLSGTQFGMRYFFQGGRYQADAATYNFRNRDYSPALGRWMQQDPMGYVDGMSAYEYVSGNPIRFVDSLGEWKVTRCNDRTLGYLP